MARKAGSDDLEPKGSGGDIPNALTEKTFLDSVKEMVAMDAKVKQLREQRSALRKTIKSRGVELGMMDATIKMADWDRGETRAHFDTGRQYAVWLGLPIGTQPDMFAGLADDDVQRKEWWHSGRTAALAGKPRVAPDDCVEAYLQDWDRGYDNKYFKVVGAKAPTPKAAPKAKAVKGEPKPGRKVKGALPVPPSSDGKPQLKLVGKEGESDWPDGKPPTGTVN